MRPFRLQDFPLSLIVAVWLLGTLAHHDAAQAADICEAVAIRDVPALEAATSVLRKGQLDTAVTQYRINKRTGQATLCSHGGYCYPMRVAVGGDLLEALKLTNCKVSDQAPYDDGEDLIYDVEPIRSLVPHEVLRYDDLDNQLLAMGLCSACADNVAQYYLKQPNSRCAVLAKSALEGNPDALATLRGNPDYCVWHY